MRKILITAALLAVAATTASLPAGATSKSQTAALAQASSNVAVVPGFKAPTYPPFQGIPDFPASDPSLAQYHFTSVSGQSITSAASLANYDTVVVYGARWTSMPQAARDAINAFALTGKVIIWDADGTADQNTSQDYSTFVHPFTEQASGETGLKKNGSVVTFTNGSDPLANSDPSSPLYLDPNVLKSSSDFVQDMSVITGSPSPWNVSISAKNAALPAGGWILAWAYGDVPNQTGMTVYSGFDADTFSDPTPSFAQTAVKALANQLGASFNRTPASCAPNCSGGGGGGGGGTGGGGGGTGGGGTTFAQCSFAKAPTKSWVHKTVVLSLKLPVATGLRGEIQDAAGKVLASAAATAANGGLDVPLNTRTLPSNKASALNVVVFANQSKACTLATSLKVDNVAPKVVKKTFKKRGNAWFITVKPSEVVHVLVFSHNKLLKAAPTKGTKPVTIKITGAKTPTAVVLSDRAGNTTFKSLGVAK